MGFDDKLTFDWGKVLSEVEGFSRAVGKGGKDPLPGLKVADKMMSFTLWLKQCTSLYEEWLPLSRTVRGLLKGVGGDSDSTLREVRAFVQRAMDSIAPETFSYSGFRITNKQHLGDDICRRALEGVDILKAVFKARGVEKVLTRGLDCINLAVVGGAPGSVAYYGSIRGADVPEITLFAGPKSKGVFDSSGLSHLIHEFGHHVYYEFLPSEARLVWDAPWESIKPENLEIPTEYGKTNKFEDFAETFVVFMTKPEMLTPTSKYRMQQVLSLSGLYGKPVMRLASDVTA